MLKKLCAYAGCHNICNKGERYCEKHSYLLAERKPLNNYTPNYSPEYSTLYNTPEWRKISREFLANNPTCVCCGNKATEVHHSIPHRGNPDIFFDKTILVPLCHTCHSRETRKEHNERQRAKREIREREKRLGYLPSNYQAV